MDTKRYTIWTGFKDSISGWWKLFDHFIVEPLLFAFAILLLLTRLQIGFEKSSSLQEFIRWIGDDMLDNPSTYTAFGVLFLLWVIFKLVRIGSEAKERREEAKERRDMINILKGIDEKIGKLGGDSDDRPNGQ